MSGRAPTPNISSEWEDQPESPATEDLVFAQPMEEEVVEEESLEEYKGFVSPPVTPEMISEEEDSSEINDHMEHGWDPDETRRHVYLMKTLGPSILRAPSPPPVVRNVSHRIPPALLSCNRS